MQTPDRLEEPIFLCIEVQPSTATSTSANFACTFIRDFVIVPNIARHSHTHCVHDLATFQNFRMRVMPLLHSLRHETNFRAYPQLDIAKPEPINTSFSSSNTGKVTDNPAADNASGLEYLQLQLDDGRDHLRLASVQLVQQWLTAATSAAAAAKSPDNDCDPKLVIAHLARMSEFLYGNLVSYVSASWLRSRILGVAPAHVIPPQAPDFLEFVPGELACESVGSGAQTTLQCFRPNPDVFKSFGDADSPRAVPVVRAQHIFAAVEAGVVAWSESWKRVWGNMGGTARKGYDVWLPIAPPGFVAIGVVCMFGCVTNSKPEEPVLCLRQCLVHACVPSAMKKVWDSVGTSSNYAVSLGRLRHGLLWPIRTTDRRQLASLPPVFTLNDEPWICLQQNGTQTRLSSLELCLLELAAQHPFTVGLQLFWLLEVEIDRVVEGTRTVTSNDAEDDGEVHGEDDKESLPVLLARVAVLHQMLLDCYGSYNDRTKGINAIPALAFKEQQRLWSKGGV